MAELDDFGAAFTGQKTDPATAQAGWDSWLERPGNRAALLQMGLQLMQPVAMGQSVGGHIAQGVGAGGEALTRAAEQERRDQLAESKLAVADEKLRIAQQRTDADTLRAGTAASRATSRKVGGLTDMFRARMDRDDARDYERRLDSDAKALAKQVADIDKNSLLDPTAKNNPVYQKYAGKSVPEIRSLLEKERPRPKTRYGSAVASDEDDDTDTASTTEAPVAPSAAAATAAEAPPYPGARKAADGNWYVQDPKNPGKYLKVVR